MTLAASGAPQREFVFAPSWPVRLALDTSRPFFYRASLAVLFDLGAYEGEEIVGGAVVKRRVPGEVAPSLQGALAAGRAR